MGNCYVLYGTCMTIAPAAPKLPLYNQEAKNQRFNSIYMQLVLLCTAAPFVHHLKCLGCQVRQDQSGEVSTSNIFIYGTNATAKEEQLENLFDCGPFDAKSKTTNQTALAVPLVCQKDQAHETVEAVSLIVSSL